LFLDQPIFNFQILDNISNEKIIVSHHGSVILEAAYLGFKTISSIACLWQPEFKISNLWSNREEYKKILDKPWDELSF